MMAYSNWGGSSSSAGSGHPMDAYVNWGGTGAGAGNISQQQHYSPKQGQFNAPRPGSMWDPQVLQGVANRQNQQPNQFQATTPAQYMQNQKTQQQQVGNPLVDAIGGATNPTQVQTSITPSNVYTGQQTQEAINQAVANQQQQANLPWLQNRYSAPGMPASSPAFAAMALPEYGAALAGAAQAPADIRLQDTRADALHWSAGEQAREGEAVGLYGASSALNTVNQSNQLNSTQTLLRLLSSLQGGVS